jgi:hypothetical protein
VLYGMIFSIALGYLVLCLDVKLTCLLVGGLMIVLKVLLCRRWCFLTFCGASVGEEMIDILRTARGCWKSSSPFFFFFFIYILYI